MIWDLMFKMNNFWRWICSPTYVEIDKIGFCYYHLLSEEDQDKVTKLINEGEIIIINKNGYYFQFIIHDLRPLPGFSGATLTKINE